MVTKTITIKPIGLLKRNGTSYWKNYTRLWDNIILEGEEYSSSNNNVPNNSCSEPDYGKISTSSTKGLYLLLPKFPTLPQNATFKSMICHVYICRYGDSSSKMQVNLGQSTDNTSAGTRTTITNTSVVQGDYYIVTDCQINYNLSDFNALSSIDYPYIFLLGADSFQSTHQLITEISIDINYEVPFDSQIYIGNKNATEIYVGNKKANAAYIGLNQVL